MKRAIVSFDELSESCNGSGTRVGVVFVLDRFSGREEDQSGVALDAEILTCLVFYSAINFTHINKVHFFGKLNPSGGKFLAVATPGGVEFYEPALITDCGTAVLDCGFEVYVIQNNDVSTQNLCGKYCDRGKLHLLL